MPPTSSDDLADRISRIDTALRPIADRPADITERVDPRDAILELDELCFSARKVGIDPSGALTYAAGLSSDDDPYGFGSTRTVLLNRAGRRT